MISQSQALRQQLEMELERLDGVMEPARIDEIQTYLARLSLHFPMTNMTPHEKGMLLDDYIEDLSAFPADIISSACVAYRRNRTNEFFPKLAVLVDACIGKFSLLTRRRKTIINAIEEAERVKERRSERKEDQSPVSTTKEGESPKTEQQKIADTIVMMRQAGAPEADIQAFMQSPNYFEVGV